MKLTLEVMSKTRLAVLRLPSYHPIPSWILAAASASANGKSHFLSITQTRDELSLVCPESIVPPQADDDNNNNGNSNDLIMEKGWISFKVQGPLDFGWTGILAGLATPLAEQGVSIFAISTFDTDYILVKQEMMDKTAQVFTELGHFVVQEDEGSTEQEK